MAQSLVTIHKLLGQQSVERYSVEWLSPIPALQLLDLEEVGPCLIFKTKHYDPTTTAVIDELQNRFRRLGGNNSVKRVKNETIDLIAVPFPAHGLANDIDEMQYGGSNINELNILHYLVHNAVSFWCDLLIEQEINSVIVIVVETLGPSLRDGDVSKAVDMLL